MRFIFGTSVDAAKTSGLLQVKRNSMKTKIVPVDGSGRNHKVGLISCRSTLNQNDPNDLLGINIILTL